MYSSIILYIKCNAVDLKKIIIVKNRVLHGRWGWGEGGGDMSTAIALMLTICAAVETEVENQM